MRKGLIGYTGFVGSNIDHRNFSDLINSKNINEFNDFFFEQLVIAAGDARKWFANQNPKEDINHIESLLGSIKKIKAKKVILISTIDIYDNGLNTEENFRLKNHAYGLNRYWLERQLSKHFQDISIIRLGGLIGRGLKKNIVYDAIHDRKDEIEKYNGDSLFQYFDLKDINKLINRVETEKIKIINAISEPISTIEILKALNYDYQKIFFKGTKMAYSIQTTHSNTGYLYTKKEILKAIKLFKNDF